MISSRNCLCGRQWAFLIPNGEPKLYQSPVIKEKGFCTNRGNLIFDRYLVDMVSLNPDIYWIQVRALDHPDNVSKEWNVGVEFQLPQIQF